MTDTQRTPVHRLPHATATIAAALALLVCLVYWPGRHGGFVFDDLHNIVRNPWLGVTTLQWRDWLLAAFSSPASELQRPLAMLTFAANHYFTGMAPMPMKLTNIAIHALNAVLVLGLCQQLLALLSPDAATVTRRRWAARFAAAAWALHPINLMAVLYVVQRMESLSHTFVFAGLWLYLLGRQRQLAGLPGGWPRVLAGLGGGTVLGLLAKESAVLLPLYAFLVEACVLRFRTAHGGGRGDRRLWLLFALGLFLPALAGLAYLSPRILSAGAWASRDFTLGERLLTEARVVVDYLRWTLLPDLGSLGLYHDDYPVSRGWLQPASTLACVLFLGGLAALATWLRRHRPLASLGIAWFLGAQLLTATVLPLELVFEHRNYFASLGVCLLMADLLLLWPKDASARRIGALLAVLALLGYASLTWLRASEWNNPIQFFRSEAIKHPTSARATYEWARVVVGLTRMQADSPLLPDAWAALERARDASPETILPHQAALSLAARTGTLDQHRDWWADLQQRLRTQRRTASTYNAMVALTECTVSGDCRFPPRDMLATYEAALHRGAPPMMLEIYGKYALHVLGDQPLALQLWRDAVARDPGEPSYRYNLARLLIDMGRYAEAREEIRRLRDRGGLGQYASLAADLERRLPRDATP